MKSSVHVGMCACVACEHICKQLPHPFTSWSSLRERAQREEARVLHKTERKEESERKKVTHKKKTILPAPFDQIFDLSQ